MKRVTLAPSSRVSYGGSLDPLVWAHDGNSHRKSVWERGACSPHENQEAKRKIGRRQEARSPSRASLQWPSFLPGGSTSSRSPYLLRVAQANNCPSPCGHVPQADNCPPPCEHLGCSSNPNGASSHIKNLGPGAGEMAWPLRAPALHSWWQEFRLRHPCNKPGVLRMSVTSALERWLDTGGTLGAGWLQA